MQILKDIKKDIHKVGGEEIRYLVSLYYTVQKYRIRSGNQRLALEKENKPNSLITWSEETFKEFERDVKSVMKKWLPTTLAGVWCEKVCGIGPILGSGLLAHIDITRAPTAGHIWSFAGLNPEQTWKKGEKRPWNAELKTLCWKAGESFVKQKGKEADIYGKLYENRKTQEVNKNERGDFKDQAERILKEKKIGKESVARKWYSTGKLPPGHLHARAKRYAVKRFLSDLHAVMYYEQYSSAPPKPWIISKGGHETYYIPPLFDIPELEGLRKELEE